MSATLVDPSIDTRPKAWVGVIALWAASRAIVLLGFWTSPHLPLTLGDRPRDVEAAVSRWDAGWLLEIAENGYQQAHQLAFFPAFPWLVSVASWLGCSPAVAALAVNSALTLVASLLVLRLGREAHSDRVGFLAAAILVFHPLSFYLFVPYTEALFVAMVAATFVAVRGGYWIAAAAFAGAAALTRNTGVLLALPLVHHALASPKEDRLELLKRWGAAVAPLTALAFYALYAADRFGEPLLFLTAQEEWKDHIRLAVPFSSLVHELGRWRAWVDHHLLLSLLGLWLAWRVVRERQWDLALFVVPSILVSFSLSKLAITPRLHLVLFPLWIEGARVLLRTPQWLRVSLAALAVAIGLWLELQFSRGLWVG